MSLFSQRLGELTKAHENLINRSNKAEAWGNGLLKRYIHPVLTAGHVPLFWEYDLNPETNPHLMKRFGINAVFNAGAIKLGDRYVLVARVEGYDRKSFFAIAESPDGLSNFHFRDYPVELPETADPDINVYDMRLTSHEDGWIYGLFCTERKDQQAPPGDETAAIAKCGIVRTRDLNQWERLPDLVTNSPQQRNVVLHPEFYKGKYAFYTRPQDGFIQSGSQGGICLGLSDCIENAQVTIEHVLDPKRYHTIYEAKNGQGPPPLKTPDGWLHLAHGVRHTAAGLRYTLYLFMTALDHPDRVIYRPGGYFMAPHGIERIGDVSNVLFANGWIADPDGKVFIYYASSDTRLHVATTTMDQLLDYVKNTPPDNGRSAGSVKTLNALIRNNLNYLAETSVPKDFSHGSHLISG